MTCWSCDNNAIGCRDFCSKADGSRQESDIRSIIERMERSHEERAFELSYQ